MLNFLPTISLTLETANSLQLALLQAWSRSLLLKPWSKPTPTETTPCQCEKFNGIVTCKPFRWSQLTRAKISLCSITSWTRWLATLKTEGNHSCKLQRDPTWLFHAINKSKLSILKLSAYCTPSMCQITSMQCSTWKMEHWFLVGSKLKF